MRAIVSLSASVFVACLALVACQHVDAAEQSAAIVAKTKAAPVAAPPAATTSPSLAALLGPEKKAGMCGGGGGSGACGGGGSCGGEGASGCTGGVTEMPTWGALPADATWTDLKVTGMHCGGCARRIEKLLSKVDGVLGVKIDVASAKVAIATRKGVDARGMVKPAIDNLGYQVQ